MSNIRNTSKTKIVGPAQVWDPISTHKTITIRTSTHQRLQRYFTKYGDTFDGVISQILDQKEGKENPNGGSF